MKKLFALIISLYFIASPVQLAHAQEVPVSNDQRLEFQQENNTSKQLLALSMGAVGSTLILGCPQAGILPSTAAYAAGSIAYIAFEIAGGKKQKEDHEKKLKETLAMAEQKKMGGENQRESIKKLLEEEKDMKSYSSKRESQLNIVSMIFMAATALAMAEHFELTAWLASPIKWPLIPLLKSPFCTGASGAISQPVALGIATAFGFVAGQASGAGLAGTIGAVGGLALTMGSTTAVLNIPLVRAGIFGANALFVKTLAGDMGKRAAVSEKRITKLNEILAQFDRETTVTTTVAQDTTAGASGGSTGGSTGGVGNANGNVDSSAFNLAALSTNGPTTATKNCISQSNSSFEVSSNCSNPVKISSPKFTNLTSDLNLSKSLNASTDFANAVARGDSEAAQIAGATISANAANVNAASKKFQNKINASLIAQGKKPLDFEKEMKDSIASYQSALNKELAQKGSSLASLGIGDLNELAAGKESGALLVNAVASTGVAIPSAKDGAQAPQEAVKISEGVVAAQANVATASSTDALGKNLSDFESSEDDISKNKEASLWKQVSNRYLSNYQRFFERKKLPNP